MDPIATGLSLSRRRSGGLFSPTWCGRPAVGRSSASAANSQASQLTANPRRQYSKPAATFRRVLVADRRRRELNLRNVPAVVLELDEHCGFGDRLIGGTWARGYWVWVSQGIAVGIEDPAQ